VQQLVEQSGPYSNLAGLVGYAGFEMSTMPWFRSTLARERGPSVAGSEIVFRNPRFIDAACRVFESDVVRPQAVVLNIMTPQGHGGAHIDTATFRGSFPVSPWLLAVMGSSGLFDRWAVRIPAALTWFYPAEGGGYEYWADGPDQPSEVVDGPFGNVALVSDNDYMFHRTRAFGDLNRYFDVSRYGSQSTVAFDCGSWVVVDEGIERLRYTTTEVRISLLWRGMAFADADAARIYDEHLDDLDVDTLVDVFIGDLADRGFRCQRPTDTLGDPSWVEALNATYGVGGFVPNT
jgi:hypothetical protein